MDPKELIKIATDLYAWGEGLGYLVYPESYKEKLEKMFDIIKPGTSLYQLPYFTLDERALIDNNPEKLRELGFTFLITFPGWEEGRSAEFIDFVDSVCDQMECYELS